MGWSGCAATQYPSSENCKVQPQHGHCQEHRPDLKPILFSPLCSREGFPLLGEVHSGNASDTREVIDELCRQFSPGQLAELVYVVDSAGDGAAPAGHGGGQVTAVIAPPGDLRGGDAGQADRLGRWVVAAERRHRAAPRGSPA